MALTKYPLALLLFHVLWAITLLLVIMAPENKYEWMIGSSVSISELPEDPDADIRVLFFVYRL